MSVNLIINTTWVSDALSVSLVKYVLVYARKLKN